MKVGKVVLITIGDPSGAGPELAVKCALSQLGSRSSLPLIIGSLDVVEDACARLRIRPSIDVVDHPSAICSSGVFERLTVLPVSSLSIRDFTKGVPSCASGRHAIAVTEAAVNLALARDVHAVCSAPTSKLSLNLAGLKVSGMSDIIASTCGVAAYSSLLVLDGFRFQVVTNHIPLRMVPEKITAGRVSECIRTLHGCLKSQFGISSPRLGVAALNPHAGEGGLYGTEEIKVLEPVINDLRKVGLSILGPIAADSIMSHYESEKLDGAVMLFHDQAQIPLKLLGGYKVATMLHGLPIIRTSVAHGTSYGKAALGTADPAGMQAAYRLACQLQLGG